MVLQHNLVNCVILEVAVLERNVTIEKKSML